MNRRTFLATATAASLLALAAPAGAQNAVIDSINTYLTNLQSAQARFYQDTPGGETVTGTFYLQKPGKMRFEYDEPTPTVIVADGQILAVFDRKSNRGPERYFQSGTPLSLLSRENVQVTQSKFVRLIETKGGLIHITMYDPEAPENGTIRLILDQAPVHLREWVITDSAGTESHIRLDGLQENLPLDRKLFSIPYTEQQLNSAN